MTSVAMSGLAVDAASGSAELTDDELSAVAGGYEYHDQWGHVAQPDGIYYAIGYYQKCGAVGVFQDFVWQLTN